MAAISQCRALAGCQAFTGVRPTQARRVANGSRVVMKSKHAYMVEVEVAEGEPEDVAVRKYMKLVMQSRVIEQLRARKTKETKIEEYKRRFRERCEMRKAGIVEPTWEELYGPQQQETQPFYEFFRATSPEDAEAGQFGDGPVSDDFFGSISGGYQDSWPNNDGSNWGTYMEPQGQAGGYMGATPAWPAGSGGGYIPSQ